jgi:hypothetical protein
MASNPTKSPIFISILPCGRCTNGYRESMSAARGDWR